MVLSWYAVGVMKIMKNPGDRVRLGLQSQSKTAAQLAERLGFSRQNMQRFLTNETGNSKYWPAIAEELGCSVEWLTTGNGNAPDWAKTKTLADAVAVFDAQAVARAAAEGIDKQEAMTRIVLENLGVKSSESELHRKLDQILRDFAEEREARSIAEKTLADRSAPRPHQRAG